MTEGFRAAFAVSISFAVIGILGVHVPHQFAHALVVTRHGGRVRSCGLRMLFHVVPTFYCDMTDALWLRRRSEKLWAIFAGVYYQLLALAAMSIALLSVLGYVFGLRELYVKDDSVNHPTCSYKDRVVSVAATRAVELGFTVFACASTGNLANSVASHAARLGLSCSVFIPDDLEAGKVTGAAVYKPRIIAVRGNYDDVNRLCTQIADQYRWGFANINLRSYYAEGAKTMGFEIVEQLGPGPGERIREQDQVRVGPVVEAERVVPAGAMLAWIAALFERIGRALGRQMERVEVDARQVGAHQREPGHALELLAIGEHARRRAADQRRRREPLAQGRGQLVPALVVLAADEQQQQIRRALAELPLQLRLFALYR